MATNMVVPIAPATHASDDEILGLTANNARKSNRVALEKKVGDTRSTVAPARNADEGAADMEIDADHSPDVTVDGAMGDADHEKLDGVLDANPELRDAWAMRRRIVKFLRRQPKRGLRQNCSAI